MPVSENAAVKNRTFDISELIDAHPLGALQIRIIFLCALVALLDGLDLQSIGLAAPMMIADLHIKPAALGGVFSTALAGLALGAFALGMLGDRVGRKTILLASTICFGVFTIATALAPNLHILLLFRFFAGFGLGGAMPSFISLTSEYVPHRQRAMVVAILWAGFPTGGFLGGLLASQIIPAFGWQSVFWVGGVLPLLVGAVLAPALPESISFLVARAAARERVRPLLQRAFPDASVPPDAVFVLREERAKGVPVLQLFAGGRALGTAMLWISFFIALLMLVTNSAWAPTLLKREGMSIAEAAFAMAAFNFGSIIGTSAAGWLVIRIGAGVVLPIAMIGTAASVALVGYAAPAAQSVIWLEGLFGLFMGCGSSGLIALSAIFYPTAIRSTGVGWAMGMGRIGSFVGPLVLGLLVAAQLSTAKLFVALALPALAAMVTAAIAGRLADHLHAPADTDG
jgi:MFS transporter, AAHS family, 4-hydroxybenzoate transporter